jgi:hypothetical protein
LDLLPPRISDPELLASLADILAVRAEAADTARLRLRLIGKTTSWQALVDLADRQGTVIPFIWALMRRSLLLPLPSSMVGADAAAHPTTQLTAIYDRHIARRRDQRDQLVAIIAALNRANVIPLLLKGARYLVAPVGPWCEARDMRDIDLLVRADDVRPTVDALQAAGYAFEAEFVPVDHHLPELWLAGCPSAVEIHTEALAFSARKILATEEVWRRGRRVSTPGGTFFALPGEWHLLHGLLNHQISDRGHVRRILAVKPLWEFAMLGSGLSEQDWRSIAGHMAASGHADVLGSWIVQATRLFGLVRPPAIDISLEARAHADATIAHAGASDWLRRGYFLADQLRFGFAKETLAVRYRLGEAEVSLATVGRHLLFLARRYRGRMLRRLTGGGDRPS